MRQRMNFILSLSGSIMLLCSGTGLAQIEPYARNPSYWQYEGRPILLFGGSDRDNIFQWAGDGTKLADHLDLLISSGGNYIRCTMSSREYTAEGHRWDLLPYPFSKVNGKYDLTRWNDVYWKKLRTLLAETKKRGIIVQLEFWDRWNEFGDSTRPRGGWYWSPWNPDNNINYSWSDSPLLKQGKTDFYNVFHDAAVTGDPVLLPWQQRFVRKVVDEVIDGGLGHVLFQVDNESGYGDDTQAPDPYWARFARQCAKSKGTGYELYVCSQRRFHPPTPCLTKDFQDWNNPDIRVPIINPAFNFCDISQNNGTVGQQHYDNLLWFRSKVMEHGVRPINNVKSYHFNWAIGAEWDQRQPGTDAEAGARLWRTVFAGAASFRFHRCTEVGKKELAENKGLGGIGLSRLAQTHLASMRKFVDKIQVFRMNPRNDLLSDRVANEAYCLAEPGRQYAVFFTGESDGRVRIELTLSDRPSQLRWLDIGTSRWGQTAVARSGDLTLEAPGSGHWVAVLTPANLGVAALCASGNTNEKSIFKGSHIAAWFDGPNDHQTYDVDVLFQDMQIVTEQEIPRWRAFARKMHDQGKLFCTQLHPLTHMGKIQEYVMDEPGMQAAVCLDFDGQPIKIGWMGGHLYKGRWPGFYCSNHPRYRAYLRHQVYMFCEVGVDGIMVDDGGGTFFVRNRGGCFCRYCMAGFRQYLKAECTAEELAQLGIRNIDTFDYRQFLADRANNNKEYMALQRQHKIPLSREFQDFLLQSDVSLFDSLQKMSCNLSGRHIPMGWDNVDFGGARAPYYPSWDVFFPEINYQRFAVDGRGSDDVLPPGIVMLNKLSDALGKWYTPTPAPRSWGSIMEGNRTGLLQQWIALTHANGGSLRYPRKGWIFSETTPWYYPPKQAFEPLYDFVRKHRELFDDYEAFQQVGVLFTQVDQSCGGKYYTPLKHVCAGLVNANIPFGVAVAGDELLAKRLTGDEADRFDVMLIPEPIRLIDGQAEIVERWQAEGIAVAIKPGDDVAEKIAGHVQPLVSLESNSRVWLFPRAIGGKTDASWVCHVVNAAYDAKRNLVVKQENVVASFANSLWKGRPPGTVTYHTIGQPPRVLPLAHAGDLLRVMIPEVDLWGILDFCNDVTRQERGELVWPNLDVDPNSIAGVEVTTSNSSKFKALYELSE